MIHPTAIVDNDAEIGAEVSIGPYSVIGPDVRIGDKTTIGPHVVITGPTRIGRGNRIFQFASVGAEPQDKKYAGEATTLEIGDENTVREFATINRGTEGGGGVTRIGDRNLFMASIHVAHDCIVGSDTIFANGSSLAGHVEVGDYAILAGFSCVHQFCRVGEHAFIGLNSVVNRDVAPFMMVVGNYATARGINKEGLRRRGFSDEAIADLHRAFKILVKRGDRSADSEALLELAQRCPEVTRLMAFTQSSERGIVRK